MLLSIEHVTNLHYSARVSETVMEMRVTPQTDSHQTLRGSRIEVGPSAVLLEYKDWLGNRVHQFSVVPFHERVRVVARAGVETHRDEVDLRSIVDADDKEGGDPRLRDFLRFHGPVLEDARLEELASRLDLTGAPTTGEVLWRITQGLRDHLRYEKGVTTSSASLPDVLDAGGGVCQDLAHVAIALCRLRKVPARYVSGYLHRASDAELETHAWCEAHVRGVGWVSFDPTHRSTASEGHVVVAYGRDFTDVPPNRGVYRGDAEQETSARVKIEEVEELPEGLLAPRAARIEIPSFDDGPRVHREQLDYQQEQEQRQQQQ